MISRIYRCAFALVFVFAASVFAQETRGTISGHVLDEQGGAMPGVTVTITNVDTNVSATLTTNSTGYYQAPLLLPGNYRVTAELQGFKTSVRSGVILSVAQQASVDLTLGVGAVSETVTVSGEAPILETGVLTTGQNLDRRSVESLPMFSNMPVLLTRFVTGVNSSAAVPYVAQGFVNRTSSDTSAPGGVGGNEWTIDGATNNGSDRRLASSPNSDMIEEVRIETANFDASFGHGTGLGISMMTRAGTNTTRGTVNYQYWNNQWNAPRYFAKRNYYANIAQAEANGNTALAESLASQNINPSGKSNNLATTLGGPIVRNKLFAFVNYSYNKDDRPVNPTQHTIPTDAHLRGDFSDLLAIDPVRYQIYDPLTVKPDPQRPGFFIRDPFPGNIIPQNRIINPMYQHYVDFLPKPNSNPVDPRQEPTNNYLVRTYTDPIQSQIYGARLDYNHSNSHRFFGRWSGSYFTEGLDDWTYQSVGIHSEDMKRTTNAGTGNWTWVKSSTTVIDAQLSANAFHEGGERKTLATLTSAGVGLPAYLDEKCAASDEARTGSSRGGSCALPIVTFGGGAGNYQQFGKNAAEGYDTVNLQVTANMTHVRAESHVEGRHRHAASFADGVSARSSQGSYTFDNTYTRRYSDTALYTPGNLGLNWAAFMLGIPTTSTINTPVDYSTSSPYYSAFAQEAWRATSKLTRESRPSLRSRAGDDRDGQSDDYVVRSRLRAGVRGRSDRGLRAKPDSRSVGGGVPRKSARRRRVCRRKRAEPPGLEVTGDVAAARLRGVSGERRHGRQRRLWRVLRLAERDRDYAQPARLQHGDDDAVEQRLRADVDIGESACRHLAAGRSVPGESGWHTIRRRRPARRSAATSSPGRRSTMATSIVSTRACSGGVRACRKSSAATWRSRWRTSARIPTMSTSARFSQHDNTQASVRQDILPAQYWNHTDTRNARSSDREQQKHHEPVFHRQPDGAACLESRAVQPAGRAGARSRARRFRRTGCCGRIRT